MSNKEAFHHRSSLTEATDMMFTSPVTVPSIQLPALSHSTVQQLTAAMADLAHSWEVVEQFNLLIHFAHMY